ncbi:hypothetical protein [Sphingomonas sp. GC_Shp_3]|uniref:hypothetical protein n=1 Tax=Sphingomonas sp. GC_Shp_3 TaxID=2937383 RepID=UPI00226990C2|nr:hypothetical protein [Sphingomonas sp. GC_Shp_3]
MTAALSPALLKRRELATDRGYTPANDAGIGLVSVSPTLPYWDEPTIRMSLEGYPTSVSAQQAVDSLVNFLGGNGLAAKSKIPFRNAIGAIVCDLLRAAVHQPVRACCRQMAAASFNGARIGYRNAKLVFNRLHEAKLVVRVSGYFDRDTRSGAVTRITPAPRLLTYLAEFGITPDNQHIHFARHIMPKKAADLVFLNDASHWKDGRRISGKRIPIDYDHPEVAARIAKLQRINAFTSEQMIGGADHAYFHCIFNQGDIPGHGYRKGGRIWSVGGGYQALSKADREGITINGQPTVELDIRSSHPVIYLTMNGIPFNHNEDLYRVPGLDRNIVKLMFNLTLSRQKIPTMWPRETKKDYLKEFGRDIAADYPFREVQERVYTKHPFLFDRASVNMDWADLQFIESEVIINTVLKLNDLGITTLPVHDSIRFPLMNMAVASYVFSMEFEKEIGIKPDLKPHHQNLIPI